MAVRPARRFVEARRVSRQEHPHPPSAPSPASQGKGQRRLNARSAAGTHERRRLDTRSAAGTRRVSPTGTRSRRQWRRPAFGRPAYAWVRATSRQERPHPPSAPSPASQGKGQRRLDARSAAGTRGANRHAESPPMAPAGLRRSSLRVGSCNFARRAPPSAFGTFPRFAGEGKIPIPIPIPIPQSRIPNPRPQGKSIVATSGRWSEAMRARRLLCGANVLHRPAGATKMRSRGATAKGEGKVAGAGSAW